MGTNCKFLVSFTLLLFRTTGHQRQHTSFFSINENVTHFELSREKKIR